MQRIETSKHPYTGLARIRSAGELVVGLDQNNLPFSTAHPRPAGLDYEIAGLLAEQLGVPLRVYWAYSAHDSYPSKLSAKQLCDVILGVMPDDRFGQRVLYSRPYYVAKYQLVVRDRRRTSRGGRAAGRGGRSRGARAERANAADLSQHRSDPGSRRGGTSQGRLRDLDAGPLAGGAALARETGVPPGSGAPRTASPSARRCTRRTAI